MRMGGVLALQISVLLIYCINAVLGAGLTWSSSSSSSLQIDAIYQFGDSISDTGNRIRQNRSDLCTSFPYGESFFHYVTGRCSDGLIMADFYAMAFGLPFLNPYLDYNATFSNGVDFSVAGATALDITVLESMNFTTGGTNSTLSVQASWFRTHLKSVCSSVTECRKKLKRSLFLMEAIGGNDYGYALGQSSFQTAYDMVPDVIQAIMDAVKDMVILGAKHVVVPGVVPFGCMPSNLATSNSTEPDMYDELGCLIDFNKLAEFHNHQLYKATHQLQMLYPNATLIYADYYFAIRNVLQNAASLGFEENAILRACCGSGDNPYNFNSSVFCGTAGVPVCPNPMERISWDGMHFTQQLYKYVSDWMLEHTIIPHLTHGSDNI